MTEVTGEADELAQEYEALLSFMYLSPVALVRSDGAGNIDMMNPMAAQLLMPLARGRDFSNLFVVLASVAPELRNFVASFGGERGQICENHKIHVSPNKENAVVLSCSIIKVGGDTLMTVLTDISRQIAAERRIQRTESWLTGIYTNVKDFAFLTLDAQGRAEGWHPSIERLTGFVADEVVGRPLETFYAPDEARRSTFLEHVALARDDGWHIEERWCRTKFGQRFWGQILVSVLREEAGGVSGYTAVIRDTTERKVASDNLERLLTRDHLTGAANRAHFFRVAEAETQRAKRHSRPLALAMFDADYFKRVNDTAGHKAGDEVLKRIVLAARDVVGASGYVGRLGGEEFVLLLPSTTLKDAAAIAERLRASIEQTSVEVGGRSMRITVSIGVTAMQDSSDALDDLLEAADRALYEAKRSGRNSVRIAERVGRGKSVA